MSINIENLSIEELKNLQVEADKLIEQKTEQSILDAYDQILAIAENTGYTVAELLEIGAKRNKQANRKSVEPRYRSKTNESDTWTGRGKQPRWLAAEIEAGAKLEDFLINK
ncbi:H-NS family nucleoid-associated regulatory protein [Acinetobacter baumannii]|uniref:H-NS histone family protein n=1 Tax=Acinetobacter baumannii TaxID=470 RepID=UPI000DF2E256|nr:H-NS histone family protein [Acinetobacter baumannii]RCT89688.1 H-NS histone family protein [Acinetobacter baumannii]